MTHVRTTIRNQFNSLLVAGLSPAEYAVLGTRTSRRNHKPTALVEVRFAEIAVSAATMGDDRTHLADLVVRVQREGPEETLDDLLDEDEARVCAAVGNFDWSQLLEAEPELRNIAFARDGESDVTIGAILLRFAVEYRIDKRNPHAVRA